MTCRGLFNTTGKLDNAQDTNFRAINEFVRSIDCLRLVLTSSTVNSPSSLLPKIWEPS